MFIGTMYIFIILSNVLQLLSAIRRERRRRSKFRSFLCGKCCAVDLLNFVDGLLIRSRQSW